MIYWNCSPDCQILLIFFLIFYCYVNLSTVLSASSFILHNHYEISPKSAFIFFSPFQINWLVHDESRTQARHVTLTFCLFYLLPQLGTAVRRLFWLEAEGHRWYQQLQALQLSLAPLIRTCIVCLMHCISLCWNESWRLVVLFYGLLVLLQREGVGCSQLEIIRSWGS